MASILGISAFYHDSAAALVVDGEIVAAAQEERFTRIKHDSNFPQRAIEYCLQEAGLAPEALDHVVFYDKPLLKFDRLLETYLAFAPLGLRSFLAIMPPWLKTRLHLPREIRKALKGHYHKRIVYTLHHESHAASAFFPSPFEEAAILTMDGVGEWHTASIGYGKDHQIRLLKTLDFPHSLGLLYSAFTYFSGFKVNSGEHKLMGLAPYGEPRYTGIILDELVDLKEDGSLAMNMDYFNYCRGLTMTDRAFDRLFGGPPRLPESPIRQRELDLAASIQKVTEEVVLRMARAARQITGCRHLCLAGGVALNCVANGRLLRSGLFDDLFIAPAAGDAGGAQGAALFVHHQLLDHPRKNGGRDTLKGSLLGPRFSDEEIRHFLEGVQAKYHHVPDETELLRQTASAIAAQKVVGWFCGRMEFGPRALGNRSILADARNETMQSVMNARIKFRESFRPFAPCVLREDAREYFELDRESPYMLLVADVRPELRCPPREMPTSGSDSPCEISASDARLIPDRTTISQGENLQKRLGIKRSSLPAITHVDMSARIQTVDEERHGRFYRLLREFKRQTGCGVLINTSFNVRGEPVVCTPQDAWRCFMATGMDMLVLENCILHKHEQPKARVEGRESRGEGRELGVGPSRDSMDSSFGFRNSDFGILSFPWQPDLVERRKFARNLLLGFPWLALVWWLSGRVFHGAWDAHLHTALWLGGGGMLAGMLFWLVPQIARPAYLAWHLLSASLGFVAGNLLLSVFYYLVLTPCGLCLRWLGKSAVRKGFDKNIPTYWKEAGPPPDPERYYHQF